MSTRFDEINEKYVCEFNETEGNNIIIPTDNKQKNTRVLGNTRLIFSC